MAMEVVNQRLHAIPLGARRVAGFALVSERHQRPASTCTINYYGQQSILTYTETFMTQN